MPVTSTPSATSALVWSWQGRAFDDPYAFVAHDNKIVTAFELVEHQNVTLMLRDGFARSLFSGNIKGMVPGLGYGLQSAPVSKNPPIVRRASFRITRDQSGQTFINTGAAATVIASLPRAEAGLSFKFIDAIGAVAFMRALPNGSANILYGDLSSLVSGGGSGYIETAGKGAFELFCDGTNWQVTYLNCSQNGLV